MALTKAQKKYLAIGAGATALLIIGKGISSTTVSTQSTSSEPVKQEPGYKDSGSTPAASGSGADGGSKGPLDKLLEYLYSSGLLIGGSVALKLGTLGLLYWEHFSVLGAPKKSGKRPKDNTGT